MAEKHEGKGKAKGSGGRTTVLTALLAIIALVAMWLSDCIPGFGIGSSGSADGEPEKSEKAEPAEPEPEPEPQPEPEPDKLAQPGPLVIVVDARGCIIGDGAPQDCAALCEQDELFEGVKEVKIDTTEGPHDKVVALLDCVKARDLPVAVTRE